MLWKSLPSWLLLKKQAYFQNSGTHGSALGSTMHVKNKSTQVSKKFKVFPWLTAKVLQAPYNLCVQRPSHLHSRRAIGDWSARQATKMLALQLLHHAREVQGAKWPWCSWNPRQWENKEEVTLFHARAIVTKANQLKTFLHVHASWQCTTYLAISNFRELHSKGRKNPL